MKRSGSSQTGSAAKIAAVAGNKSTDTSSMNYQIIAADARDVSKVVQHNSVDLVVTSPPYPMISMWDDCFRAMDTSIPPVEDWTHAMAHDIFEKMNLQLDKVWMGLRDVVKDGGIVVINTGDATRTVESFFQLFPNGARTTMGMMKAGFTPLPNIYWKKPTNAPNKFMGSGFYPVNAYVTLDCEHILIFRKGPKRAFPAKDPVREKSTFTKEQRNAWFTQTWQGVTGASQAPIAGRRTAAFPEEIPSRLISMFSVIGDVVLDPFVGTGTTVVVARRLKRKAIGMDIDNNFVKHAEQKIKPRGPMDAFCGGGGGGGGGEGDNGEGGKRGAGNGNEDAAGDDRGDTESAGSAGGNDFYASISCLDI